MDLLVHELVMHLYEKVLLICDYLLRLVGAPTVYQEPLRPPAYPTYANIHTKFFIVHCLRAVQELVFKPSNRHHPQRPCHAQRPNIHVRGERSWGAQIYHQPQYGSFKGGVTASMHVVFRHTGSPNSFCIGSSSSHMYNRMLPAGSLSLLCSDSGLLPLRALNSLQNISPGVQCDNVDPVSRQ